MMRYSFKSGDIVKSYCTNKKSECLIYKIIKPMSSIKDIGEIYKAKVLTPSVDTSFLNKVGVFIIKALPQIDARILSKEELEELMVNLL